LLIGVSGEKKRSASGTLTDEKRQSEVPPGAAINDYEAALDPGFTNTLNAQLATFHSAVTPAQTSARARALSCAGCHQISGVDPQHNGLGGGLIACPFAINGFTMN